MTFFLEEIASQLYKEYGNTLNRHCLVFPGRRAGLYFLKYLADKIEKPVWMPTILTVNELFRSFSSLQPAGNEMLLFELYKIYREVNTDAEIFDEFYYWADMLVNDFDDVDKYMVDASALFTNVKDIKNIDRHFGDLTVEQVEIIKRFWVNINIDNPTNEKKDFIAIWEVLHDLYIRFKDSLRKQNKAYEGMIFRDLAEDPEPAYLSDTSWDIIHFIGFNALNECEKVIMKKLKNAGRARFYWDYDNSYIRNDKLNSAGYFMRDNLRIFDNDMPEGWSYDTSISGGSPYQQRRVIDTSSDVAQVRLLPKLLEELSDITEDNAHQTAIVLADESLLMPLLSTIPEDTGDVNITMGYPLKHTLVYSLLKQLINLYNDSVIRDGILLFRSRDVIAVVKNALIEGLSDDSDKDTIERIVKSKSLWIPAGEFEEAEHLKKIFIRPPDPSSFNEYLKEILSVIALKGNKTSKGEVINTMQRNIINEFLYRVVLSVNRLGQIVGSKDLVLSTRTYLRILDRVLRGQSVPFSGEPLSGIQIMGILETRTLDFKNLIILSVNEGVLPSVAAGSSFIPYSLREAFGLPSVNHQESIYAYHFYRLLHRAEDVTFVYNSNSEGLRSGEMSRFLIQMKYESMVKTDYLDLCPEIETYPRMSENIERNEEHQLQLFSRFLNIENRRVLSPSAINTWLGCRMKFFFRYISNLKEPERISQDIDPAMFGTMLHEIMHNLYKISVGEVLTEDNIRSIINDKKHLGRLIDEVVSSGISSMKSRLESGNELIIRDVLLAYLLRILNTDRSVAPLTILSLEERYGFSLPVKHDGDLYELGLGGIVDRIDSVNGIIRVVDYKSGNVSDAINSVEELFMDDRRKEYDGWLQALLYCEAYLTGNSDKSVVPSIYKVKKVQRDPFADRLTIKGNTKMVINDYRMIRDEFIKGLEIVVNTIFNPVEPFYMTKEVRKCSYCPYKNLCMR